MLVLNCAFSRGHATVLNGFERNGWQICAGTLGLATLRLSMLS